MTTNTSNHGWPKPVFPSENVASELDTFFDEIDKAVSLRGPDSSLPSAGTAGRLYFTTDTQRTLYDDGTEWQDITPGGGTYSDELAQDAVGTILGGQFTYDDATPSINLNQGAGSGLDADTVDGQQASDFSQTGHVHDDRYYTESETDTLLSSKSDTGHTHSLGDLADVTATGEGSGNGLDADTVDGSHATDFAQSGHTHDSRYYTESEVDTALSGKSDTGHTHSLGDLSDVSATGEGSGGGFDADTVDGLHASELSGGGDKIFHAEDTNTNINNSNNLSWNNTILNDSPYSFNGTTVTIQEGGWYEIEADADFRSRTERTNSNIGIQVNGNWAGVLGRSGYVRDRNGHDHASVHTRALQNLSSGDDVRVRGIRDANSRTIVPDRAQFTIKKLNR